MDKIIKRCEAQLGNLKGSRVLVTGATGLIGKALMRLFLEYNVSSQIPIYITACVRNRGKAEGLFGTETDELRYITGDVRNVDLSDVTVDYIVHAASETSSQAFVRNPVDTIGIALDGTRHLLDYACTQKLKKFVYTSTMEVYGSPVTDEKITEEHGTNLDTMKVRSSYPESKRACESLCASYFNQYQVPAVVLRLTQTFGPGVNYDDKRVFAEFARCAIEGRDIVLKTKGETKRSYLHAYDAASAILYALTAAEPGEAYNTANEETYCSIYEMAQLVSSGFGGEKTHVVIEEQDITKFGYAPTLKMNLDTGKLRKLGWIPEYDLKKTFLDLIKSMRES